MKVEFLPSTVGTLATKQFCISAVINDTIAIDAGSIGLLWPVERQMQIQQIFLSHSHLDHVASLPLFLDNIYRRGPDCPSVYACEATIKCLREMFSTTGCGRTSFDCPEKNLRFWNFRR